MNFTKYLNRNAVSFGIAGDIDIGASKAIFIIVTPTM